MRHNVRIVQIVQINCRKNRANMSRQDAERERQSKLVTDAAASLMEHFDTVQIFATKYEAGETVSFKAGSGNWYSRYGQICEWAQKQQTCMDIEAAQEIQPDDDAAD